MRRVVCAAIKTKFGLVIGPRHFDMTMHRHIDLIMGASNEEVDIHNAEQGFIDQHGVFMDRKEARIVADAAYQIVRDCDGDPSELYSENLY